jgi:hypothetical protein
VRSVRPSDSYTFLCSRSGQASRDSGPEASIVRVRGQEAFGQSRGVSKRKRERGVEAVLAAEGL